MQHRTRLSTKGQIVLPQSIRTVRRWKPGTEFIVEEDEDGVRLKPAIDGASPGWESLIGCAAYRGPRKSLRQMEEALTAEARRHK